MLQAPCDGMVLQSSVKIPPPTFDRSRSLRERRVSRRRDSLVLRLRVFCMPHLVERCTGRRDKTGRAVFRVAAAGGASGAHPAG